MALHSEATPLLLPNAWDRGSAALLESVGFKALATTSGGYAMSLALRDGQVDARQTLEHVASLVELTDLPINADLEHGYGDDPDQAADTIRRASRIGAAGASIEDWDPVRGRIYDLNHARDRIAASAEATRSSGRRLVLTARAENHFRGRDDLDDTIARLCAYQDAGADVLYAPGVIRRQDIARVIEAIDRPLNVLAVPGVPELAELAELGVARVSLGGGLTRSAYAAAQRAATGFLERGAYPFEDLQNG